MPLTISNTKFSPSSTTVSDRLNQEDNTANNPHYILTQDLIRNINTLECQFDFSLPPDSELLVGKSIAMRGYFGIMSSSDSSTVDLHGNGEKVKFENKHCLWQPKSELCQEPVWHLRVQVLRDHEGRGDAPSRIFAFKSLHHLTHAANQLEAAFSETYDITMKKCGVEVPNAMGDRVNDGRCENITIEFDSDSATQPWSEFLHKLKDLEDEWDHEGRHEGLSVL